MVDPVYAAWSTTHGRGPDYVPLGDLAKARPWEDLLREAASKADALIEKKSNDYGHFSLYPDIVLASLIWVKGRRILEIVQKQKTPNFESIEDSCLDILNYVRFLYAKQKKGE